MLKWIDDHALTIIVVVGFSTIALAFLAVATVMVINA